jgi:hypothetical protein
MTEKEIFSHKAPNYLLCFINECPRRATCLRWLVGQELQSNDYNILSVNPMHPEVKANKCALYREKKHVRYAKGMMHFYDEMTRSQEVGIKHRLIVHYGRRQYYEYRRGERLISPEMQAFIGQVCKEHGYTKEPHYDGWQDDYAW